MTQLIPGSVYIDKPNIAQPINLDWISPSPQNFRLHIERIGLTKLRSVYKQYSQNATIVLPDFPVLRFHDYNTRLEILAGERRLLAAKLEGLKYHQCRVVQMSDEEAVRFIIEHNDVTRLTTAEIAYTVAELDRLGYSAKEIRSILGEIGVDRYLVVGRLLNPDLFTDDPKAEVSITTWYAAAQEGSAHFQNCFLHWNLGLWNEAECKRRFTRADKKPRADKDAQGFRITTQDDRLIVRGTVDLRYVNKEQAESMVSLAITELQREVTLGLTNAGWSPHKRVTTILPDE